MWLFSWKTACCEEFSVRLTLDLLQQASRWANHTVTRKQKIRDYWDIVVLFLHCTCQCLVCSCLWETQVTDIQIHTHTYMNWLPYAFGACAPRHDYSSTQHILCAQWILSVVCAIQSLVLLCWRWLFLCFQLWSSQNFKRQLLALAHHQLYFGSLL